MGDAPQLAALKGPSFINEGANGEENQKEEEQKKDFPKKAMRLLQRLINVIPE